MQFRYIFLCWNDKAHPPPVNDDEVEIGKRKINHSAAAAMATHTHTDEKMLLNGATKKMRLSK